jgi:hypothetical protein
MHTHSHPVLVQFGAKIPAVAEPAKKSKDASDTTRRDIECEERELGTVLSWRTRNGLGD